MTPRTARRIGAVAALASLVGCSFINRVLGRNPAPAPVVAPVAPPKPACIAASDEAAAITHATGEATRVAYCIGASTDECFALDLATAKLERLAEPPRAQSAALDTTARIDVASPKLDVCSPDGCKPLAAQVFPGAAKLRAATNGAVAAVLLGDAETGKGYVDVWDVATQKRTATFKYARDDYRCGDVAMLEDTIYISASTCQGPSARGAIYTLAGKKIANVGGKDFGTYGNAFVQLDPGTWAFLEESGNRIAVQDVVTGKVAKTIEVGELWRGDTPAATGSGSASDDAAAKEAFGNPGESALVRLAAAKLAVIGGTPANGSVAVVDLATGEVHVTRATACPK